MDQIIAPNMIKMLLMVTLFAGVAWAETTPEWKAQQDPQVEPTKPAPEDAPAKVGYEKAESNVFPKTASYDGKWTVEGFSIVNAQGETAFAWKDFGATQRIDMIVSWSPDSQRVVLLDQFNRGAALYAAELLNGVWRNVHNRVNLNPLEITFIPPLKESRVNRVNLGQWVSTTAIQIQDHFLVTDIDMHRDGPVEAHWQDATAILQFSNGSLRLVN
jgi:hypothetical protein